MCPDMDLTAHVCVCVCVCVCAHKYMLGAC